jgi:hypothetical protein
MDLKALMQKLETINTTQTLTESTEERVVITESVNDPVSIAETTFKSSIARSLAEEFGYELDEADPNDPNGTSALAGQQKAMQDARAKKDGSTDYTSGLNPAKSGTGLKAPAGAAATMGQGGQAASPAAAPAETPAAAPTAAPAKEPGILDKVGNFFKQNAADYDARQKADAAANSPEGLAAAKAKLTPSQLKWLGGAEPNPIILSRMPAPLPGEVAGGAPAAGDKGAGAELSAAAGGDAAKNPTGANAATAIPGGAAAGGAAAPAASTADPKQVARLKELLAKAKGAPAAAPAVPGVKAGGGVVDTRGGIGGEEEMEESVHTYFSTDPLLERLRAIEALPLMEALTADEYKELQKIAASLQVDNPQDKELQALTKQALELPAQFAADTPAAPAAPAAPAKPGTKPGADGAVGQDLAKMGVSKQNRLDQAFIDKTLGAGKYKAGSAEANLALQAFMKKQGGVPAAAAPATAAPAASLGGKSFKDASAAANAATPAAGTAAVAGVAVGSKPDGVAGQRPTMANDPRLAGAPAAPASPQQQATDDAIYKQAKAAGATGSTSTQQVTGAAAVDAAKARMRLPPSRPVTPPSDAQMAKMPESVQSSDDQILAIIRDIRIN